MKALVGLALFLAVLFSVHAAVGYLFKTATPGYAMSVQRGGK